MLNIVNLPLLPLDFVPCLKNCFASCTFILDVKLFFLSCNDLMLLVRLTLVDAGA